MRVIGKFFDDKNFARGFNRSGEFTINEAKLLETYGQAMKGLLDGTFTAQDEEERIFTDAFKEGGDEIKTPYVNTWRKYLSKAHKRRTHSLCSTIKNSNSSDDSDEEFNDNDDLLLD